MIQGKTAEVLQLSVAIEQVLTAVWLQSIDEFGWLHSGDKGKVDEDGMLFITGRYKELLITAGGVSCLLVHSLLPCYLLPHSLLASDRS